eukprot:gene6470-6698_t
MAPHQPPLNTFFKLNFTTWKVVSDAPHASPDPAVFAKNCPVPPALPAPRPLGVPIPPLPASERPNFIIILTDDQGWDDISMNHPQKPDGRPEFVRTPNLDRFIQRGTLFDNYYVSPMCSHSRAALLTGREYAKTGTMLVNGGYDYINRDEPTSGHVMQDNGYKTAHYGKWHNGRTLGYEPWQMGFQESWFPELYINLDNLMRSVGPVVVV